MYLLSIQTYHLIGLLTGYRSFT